MGLMAVTDPLQEHETAPGDFEGTYLVSATVFALIPEFEQVLVRDDEGFQYALTPRTAGIELGALREGQVVVCTVTRRLPQVLAAQAVA